MPNPSHYCQFIISMFKEQHLELKDVAILAEIHQAGTCNQNHIAESLNIESAHVSTGCAKLENRNLILRRPSPRSTREILCSLSKEGEKFITRHSKAANKNTP